MEAINWTAKTERKIEEAMQKVTQGGKGGRKDKGGKELWRIGKRKDYR